MHVPCVGTVATILDFSSSLAESDGDDDDKGSAVNCRFDVRREGTPVKPRLPQSQILICTALGQEAVRLPG